MLDSDGQEWPFEWWAGQLCRAFPGRFPSEIWAEMQRLPEGMLEQIVLYWAYAEMKAAWEAWDKGGGKGEKPSGRLAELVLEIEFELVKESIDD